MLEKILGSKKMNILQCQATAKKIGFDRTTFDLCGPTGRRKAKWVDAYFGFFEVEGEEKLFRANDL